AEKTPWQSISTPTFSGVRLPPQPAAVRISAVAAASATRRSSPRIAHHPDRAAAVGDVARALADRDGGRHRAHIGIDPRDGPIEETRHPHAACSERDAARAGRNADPRGLPSRAPVDTDYRVADLIDDPDRV